MAKIKQKTPSESLSYFRKTITAFGKMYYVDGDGDVCCLTEKPCKAHKNK